MLAKLWKKLLFAICIIACLFNITYKLVNRHSLKSNLESVNDGETVFDLSSESEGSSEGATNNNSNNTSDGEDDNDKAPIEYDGVKRVVIYDADGNIVDEYNTADNVEDILSSVDDSNRAVIYDKNGNLIIDSRNPEERKNLIERIKNSNLLDKDKYRIEIEEREANEVYTDVPVYEKEDVQYDAGDNKNYIYKYREYLDVFRN